MAHRQTRRPVSALIDHVQQTTQVDETEAVRIARVDFEWHQFHTCPNRTPSTSQEPTP